MSKFHPVEIKPLYLSTHHERLGWRSNREILSEIPSCLHVGIFAAVSAPYSFQLHPGCHSITQHANDYVV